MRKRIKTKKLSRSTNQRKALFRQLVVALVEHEEIKTTKAKAKAVRSLVEKLITKGKKGTLHSRRLIQRVVVKRQVANKIVEDLAKRYANRPGGYTKLVNLGNRRGDNASLVKLAFIKEEVSKSKSSSAKSSSKTKKTKESTSNNSKSKSRQLKSKQSSSKTNQSTKKSTKSKKDTAHDEVKAK